MPLTSVPKPALTPHTERVLRSWYRQVSIEKCVRIRGEFPLRVFATSISRSLARPLDANLSRVGLPEPRVLTLTKEIDCHEEEMSNVDPFANEDFVLFPPSNLNHRVGSLGIPDAESMVAVLGAARARIEPEGVVFDLRGFDSAIDHACQLAGEQSARRGS